MKSIYGVGIKIFFLFWFMCEEMQEQVEVTLLCIFSRLLFPRRETEEDLMSFFTMGKTTLAKVRNFFSRKKK